MHTSPEQVFTALDYLSEKIVKNGHLILPKVKNMSYKTGYNLLYPYFVPGNVYPIVLIYTVLQGIFYFPEKKTKVYKVN